VRGLRVFARRCFVVAVTDTVLARVGRPFPAEPIRTLDAVHLATAELLGEPPPLVTIVTRDARVRDNTRARGYAVEEFTSAKKPRKTRGSAYNSGEAARYLAGLRPSKGLGPL
jgi:hypothetical protein